jgi:uncharacterized protein (TIGR04255 family)
MVKMPEVEIFPRSPIVEAILSFEVPYLDDLTVSAGYFHDAIHPGYPTREVLSPADAAAIFPQGRIRAMKVPILSGRDGTVHRKLRETTAVYGADARGYSFRSEDGLQVVRVTRRGLSFHRLKPYLDWGHFESAVQFVWREFVSYFGPEYVSRLRVRYLNRIEVPHSFARLEEFLRLYPSVPDPIDTGLSGYLMRLVLQDESVPAVAHITHAVEADLALPYIPMIFDIDVRREGELSTAGPTLWEAIHAMREYKDRLFFESITEDMKELFR